MENPLSEMVLLGDNFIQNVGVRLIKAHETNKSKIMAIQAVLILGMVLPWANNIQCATVPFNNDTMS